MQRARRRKLLRQAKRDPMLVEAVKARDAFRHEAYQGINRADRGVILRAKGPASAGLRKAIDDLQEQTR